MKNMRSLSAKKKEMLSMRPKDASHTKNRSIFHEPPEKDYLISSVRISARLSKRANYNGTVN